MAVNVINHCSKRYQLAPENIVTNILKKIPEKFLMGLDEVHIFDIRRNAEDVGMKYIRQTSPSEHIIIEVYMDTSLFSGGGFFSILCFNTDFIMAINTHIEEYVQPHSHDQEILSYPYWLINYAWVDFGKWSPVLSVFKLLNYVISRFHRVRILALALANRVFKFNRSEDVIDNDRR